MRGRRGLTEVCWARPDRQPDREFSLRREQVCEVRRWLGNYHRLREALEAICELNHDLLRPEAAAPRRGRKNRD